MQPPTFVPTMIVGLDIAAETVVAVCAERVGVASPAQTFAHSFGAIGHVQFGVNGRYVKFYSVLADSQRNGDLFVCQSLRK